MATTTKNFGKYQVKVNTKTQKVSIYYVWSARDKELFKADVSYYSALTCLRDFYLNRNSEAYAEAKAFFLPLIATEF